MIDLIFYTEQAVMDLEQIISALYANGKNEAKYFLAALNNFRVLEIEVYQKK